MADTQPPEQRGRTAQDKRTKPGPNSRRNKSRKGRKATPSSDSGPPNGIAPVKGAQRNPVNGDAGAGGRNWRRPPHKNFRQSFAAIDLGTNNCRLLIARPKGDEFVVIDAFSKVVRLGEDLAKTGRLSDAAMDRAVDALRVCSEKLRKRGVHLARSVATEACRRAQNGDQFIQRVKRETGIALDIISAQEEARLAVLGCHILLEDGVGPAVIFDIGGGSTELVLIEQGGPIPRIVDWQSVPWGVVSLTDTAGRDETTRAQREARYAKMRQLVSDSFAGFAERIKPHMNADLRLLGTSGTVTTLASVHLGLTHYNRREVDGLILPTEGMREITESLSAMSFKERSNLPIIGVDRAELVVAGCAILESILDIWPAPRLGVADRGIREGILRSLMLSEHDGAEARAALHAARENGRDNGGEGL